MTVDDTSIRRQALFRLWRQENCQPKISKVTVSKAHVLKVASSVVKSASYVLEEPKFKADHFEWNS